MEHERHHESEPGLSLAEKRRRIVELFERNWRGGRHFPFMPEVTDESGRSLEKSGGGAAGQIAAENIETDDRLIRSVKTGTGYIAIGEPELMTKEITGCMGVLVRGKTKDGKPLSALLHLTPTTKLPWGNFRAQDDDGRWGQDCRASTAEKIAAALAGSDADLENCTALLIRTVGYSNARKAYNGYAEERQIEKTAALARELEARGLKSKELAPLMMETATIFWSPEAPDEILAVGEKRVPHPSGGADEPPTDEKGVVSEIIKVA